MINNLFIDFLLNNNKKTGATVLSVGHCDRHVLNILFYYYCFFYITILILCIFLANQRVGIEHMLYTISIIKKFKFLTDVETQCPAYKCHMCRSMCPTVVKYLFQGLQGSVIQLSLI